MPFVQRDQVVQHFTENAADPPFGDSVLPGASHTGPNGLDSACLQKAQHLDVTDLVFIDPVSTGDSRAISEQDAKNFRGISRGELRNHSRGRAFRPSPTAAGHGAERYHAGFHGVEFPNHQLQQRKRSAVYFVSAHVYSHGLVSQKAACGLDGRQRKAINEAEQFASHEYNLVLMKGDSISAEERAQIVDKLARLTGLPPKFIDESNLRMPIFRFAKELLRDQRHARLRPQLRQRVCPLHCRLEQYVGTGLMGERPAVRNPPRACATLELGGL